MLTPNVPDSPEIKTISDYVDLIETVVKVEYTRLKSSSHLIDFAELVNIATMAVHIILTTHKGKEFNSSYLSTAIKWAIRNELRRRYRWYSLRHQILKHENGEDQSESGKDTLDTDIREAIYETVLSIEDIAEAENPTQIKDSSFTPDESLELIELNKAIRKAINKLNTREKKILEMRFYKGKRIREISSELNISSSRVSRIIQTGLDRVKNDLIKQDLV